MDMRRLVSTAAVTGGLLSAVVGGQASAAGTIDGCPPSYIVWQVGVTGPNPPYQAPGLADKNGDKIVCAKQIDNKTFEYQGQNYPLYNFIDNSSVKP
jgi:hypothetical protein